MFLAGKNAIIHGGGGVVQTQTPQKPADVTEVAAFLAAGRAAGMTGSMANVTRGLVLR